MWKDAKDIDQDDHFGLPVCESTGKIIYVNGYERACRHISDRYVWLFEHTIKTIDVENVIIYDLEVQDYNSYVVENAITQGCRL